MNVVANTSDDVVENFGWPCYEGPSRQSRYDNSNLSICENLYGESDAHTDPFYAYRHADKVVPGEECPTGGSSIAGLAFYTGGEYPPEYDGALFFSDYSRRCIWVMFADEEGNLDPSTRTTFVSSAARPVSLQIGPNGDLFYIDLGGTVRRIQYFSDNQPPTATIDADPSSGIAPLTVSFDASHSSDPDPDDTLTYEWDLDGEGDYDDSTDITPTYDYEDPGSYVVRLRVTDSMGDSDTDSIVITANNTPPTAIIDTPLVTDTWRVGDMVTFSGHAEDTQDETFPDSAFAWGILLHHCYSPTNCHIHPLIDVEGIKSGTFNAPDHEYPSYLELQLTVTDSEGLQDSTTISFYPETVDFSFESEPPGITMGLNSTTASTPFTQTVIVGSNNEVDTPASVEIDGITYTFDEWSDGGTRSHTIVAGEDSVIYTATYSIDFPATNVLDDFDRPDGDPGPNWVGNTTGYGVEDNTLTMANGSSILIYWDETFGPDQEAYVTLTSINDHANEIDLLLKGQGSGSCNVLEVLYDPRNDIVQVWTCHNYGTWIQHGADLNISFEEGDRFGAHAHENGTVDIYQNDTLAGSVTVANSWPYRDDGGRIGIWTINAQNTVMDDFGGGTR
ncbi:MAG: Glucose/arabinose dehydrogenase, beta-propeller fold [Chloroflexi bacterium AL-W]|nr:Glucose/arabinose dehydrogenase, beta-propeller fold [Chloroflexi bacterium AL-N1]NOK67270.1 Glucose/arabinose dehydrogenase, beta-propeller fold [Chloroflexi bacterium AL-N10]NOK75236.1 Glucose/arabinose dehydrogenase, beta-propeller fold [Chloroflexi bacterium AL-N5]NOK82024.1 Glucose/arabinose dehydrogenase, beta-propeller fold [Chloroflexi bacterium AL-W]NOK89869.1 Glucose/arabinose dehydrogenase, beta-propeller fold [Chloroflexi bacterium AL-N15]